MRKYPPRAPLEATAESSKPSALELQTNEQAPSAPAPSKATPDLSLPPKPVKAIEALKKHDRYPRGHGRYQGSKSEKSSNLDQPSTSEKQPQEPAPAPSASVTPAPAASADPPTTGPRRGSKHSRRSGPSGPNRRPNREPPKDSPTVPTPRQPSMEPDSSSACSSSVHTPTHHPASLTSVDEHPPSGSQTVTRQKNNQMASQFEEHPVGLDAWAESTSNEDMWKADPAENSWGPPVSTTSIHIDHTTPSHAPIILAPAGGHRPLGSQPADGPKNDEERPPSPEGSGNLDTWAERTPNEGGIEKTAQSPDSPVSLGAWAESGPNEDWCKPDPPESSRGPAVSTTPIQLDRRSTPSIVPSIAAPIVPPAAPSTPSNELSGPVRAIQPSVEESPTSMRRVGLAYVLLGPGASVQAVFTDAESPWVVLSGLPKHVRRSHVQSLLAPFGPTRTMKIFEPRRETKYLSGARILFERHEQARYAVDNLHGQLVMGKPITARLDTDASGGLNSNHIPGLNDDTAGPSTTKPQSSLIANDPQAVIKSATVKVTWFAPTSTVYVTYQKARFAMEKVKEMNGRTFMNRRVKMIPMFSERDNNLEQTAKENGGYMVRVTGLMGDPELDKLRRFVRSNDIVVHPNYSSEIALRKLREELADVAPLESFRLLPNRRDDLKYHALAQYTTPAAAAAAVKVFEGRRGEYLANSPIMVSRHLSVRYSISAKLAEVLQGEINKIHSWAIDDPDLYVRQNEDPHKPGFIQLLLAGNNTKQLVTAKSQLDRALGGVPLSTVDGVKIWDTYFTTEEGSSFLESVAEKCKICARVDKRTNSILLFGPGYAREEASQQLRSKLVTHSRLRHVTRIQKPVLRRLAGGGITILRDLVGKGNIYVDIFDETLTFYGDDEVARRVQSALDLMYSETGAKLRRRSDCVVCFCRPEKALLFSCGHHYCKSCFSQYVASAAENRTLPLLCIGEGCKASIPLSMITLHADQPDQEALFYAAFQAYVTAHPDQYRYCPTPDCQYIYRVGPEDSMQGRRGLRPYAKEARWDWAITGPQCLWIFFLAWTFR
ncbi:hypothetical protein OPQ81_008958 [Rhizoctonia solani]|nr:hypothetical protein OPQ81_008958 [Rhizoctonia solani]